MGDFADQRRYEEVRIAHRAPWALRDCHKRLQGLPTHSRFRRNVGKIVKLQGLRLLQGQAGPRAGHSVSG